jgi:acyl-CoA ligase (AMP-forming) (exosortase A-associated)
VTGMLIHELIRQQAETAPRRTALRDHAREVDYAALAKDVACAANLFLGLGLGRHERVAVYMDKRIDTVAALFGAAAAGGVFVPVNPLHKPEQVAHILKDCNVRILVTTLERLELLRPIFPGCSDLRCVVAVSEEMPAPIAGLACANWAERSNIAPMPPHRAIDADMAAILYTSGSTGKPKGVVLSHRNLVAGAESVSHYLENRPEDRILALLPLSFDYGLNQLTTAFRVGACAVLMNYLLPRDVIQTIVREQITGLAAVPPLWIQLAQLDWPAGIDAHLRYITNSGGALPTATLAALRVKLPKTLSYLMYGLTEAFRSTYLPPSEVDRRPGSIGKAIPGAEVLVVRQDGSLCRPDEPGELVHRGVHVTLGYWNDPEKTAERYRPAPGQPTGLPMPEMAVWSGDTVKMDEEGFLYFIGRRDEMIKTSGYRVSPTEVEEVIYATGLVAEAAAIGLPHPVLGQSVALAVFTPDQDAEISEKLLAECQRQLPAYMVPARIAVRDEALPRGPNGKLDRKQLAEELADIFEKAPS